MLARRVMSSLRFAMFASFSVAACAASNPPEGPPSDTTVRERLATPTKMMVTLPDSSGTLTASRYTHDGWQDGSIAIAIANGELDVHAAADGTLSFDGFAIKVDQIDIPESVFGKAAELRDVRLVLSGAPAVTTTWVDDNDALATAKVSLDLSWSLFVDGAGAPLGTQHLGPLPFDLALTGSGDQVNAKIALHASGDLWTWASLLKLTGLDLDLAATTAY